jgi:hypothetical protein
MIKDTIINKYTTEPKQQQVDAIQLYFIKKSCFFQPDFSILVAAQLRFCVQKRLNQGLNVKLKGNSTI